MSEVLVRRMQPDEARPWCLKRHYARRVPSISFAFGLYVNLRLVGVVTYGSPSTPQIANGMFIGVEVPILELNRLCIDTETKNAASALVGRSLRELSAPSAVVSYADTAHGHVGYVYQATNFIYTGAVTAHDSEYIVDGVKTHPRTLAARGISAPREWARRNSIEAVAPKPKHRYVFLIGSKAEKRRMLAALQYPIVAEYPKGDVGRYDVGPRLATQGILF